MKQHTTYSGIDLLNKIFEFIAMTPDQNQWHLSSLKSNPPRQIRFRQIQSLINAFTEQPPINNLFDKTKALFSKQNSFSIESILSGDFIKHRSLDDYSELIGFIKQFVAEKETQKHEERPLHVEHLIMPYQQLIKYKQALHHLMNFNGGWLEASSIPARFSIYLTHKISANISGNHTDLDSALELFINPKKLSFSETELIANFQFPKEDLDDIDMDYM